MKSLPVVNTEDDIYKHQNTKIFTSFMQIKNKTQRFKKKNLFRFCLSVSLRIKKLTVFAAG